MILFIRQIVFVFLTILATVSISTSERYTNGLLHNVKGLFQSAINKWYQNDITQIIPGREIKNFTAALKKTLETEFHEKSNELDELPAVSVPLNISHQSASASDQHSAARDERQGACTCTVGGPASFVPNTCTITCLSYETRCGQTCTVTTVFTASSVLVLIQSNPIIITETVVTQTTSISYDAGCPGLPCASTSVYCVYGPGILVGVVAGFAAGIGAGIGIKAESVVENVVDISTIEQVRIIGEETPVNNLDTPVLELRNFTADGCRNNSVRFNFGNCTPLLRRRPCPTPYRWVTAHPVTLQV